MDLNQVTVGAVDLERSEVFYQLLGLRLIVRNDRYLRFECPDGTGTFSVDLVDEVVGDETVTVYFEDADVDGLVDRLQRAGLHFEHPLTDKPWLWREARLRDPDGHRLCIFQAGETRRNPPWRLP